jgi:fucose permease
MGGFRTTLVIGLLIYSCGTLAFWPAADLVSVPGFATSNFIVVIGLSVVDMVAHLFIAWCGPMEHIEMRLNFARSVQGVGGVVSPLLVEEVSFGQPTSPTLLIGVHWTHLVI